MLSRKRQAITLAWLTVACLLGLPFAPALFGQVAPVPELRTWTDDTGAHQIEAAYVGLRDGYVFLRRPDGKEFSIPLERLSEADQQHVEGLSAKPRPDGNANQLESDTAGLVIVAFRNEQAASSYMTGLVIAHEGEQCLIVCESKQAQAGDGAEQRYEILVPGSEARPVAAEVMAVVTDSEVILKAPATSLPKPIARPAVSEVRTGDGLVLVGVPLGPERQTTTDGLVRATAKLTRFSDSDQGISGLAEVTSDVRPFSRGLALTTEGVPLAMADVLPTVGGRTMARLSPLPDIDSLGAPKVVRAFFAPRSGDLQRLTYQFVVDVLDPLDRVGEAELRVAGPNYDLTKPATPEDSRAAFEAATALKMSAGEIDPLVAVQRDLQFGPPPTGPQTKTYVADLTLPHPGPNRFNGLIARAWVQFSHRGSSGDTVVHPQQGLEYSSEAILRSEARFRLDGAKEKISRLLNEVPGLDGLPLDMVQPEQLPDGGWLVTSERTRVPEVATGPKPEFPRPVEARRVLFTEPTPVGSFVEHRLDLVGGAKDRLRRDVPLVFSPDGSELYYVDGENILQRISVDSLSAKASLDLGTPCDSMAYSKSGLVLALAERNVVWLVDPASLEVTAEIAVKGALMVAASPATSVAVCGISLEPSTGPVAWHTMIWGLVILDLERRQPVHQVKNKYGLGREVQIGFEKPLHGGLALRMSPDGRYLYNGDRSIYQFELRGHDLIYRRSTPFLKKGNSHTFDLSVDGKFLAMPVGSGNGPSSYNILVFATSDLTKPHLDLPNGAYPTAIGWDPAMGQIYSANGRDLIIWNAEGEQVGTFRHELNNRGQIVVHPKGGQFIVWAPEQIRYYRSAD